MSSRARELDAEESGIGIIGVEGLSSVDEDVLVEDILLQAAHLAAIAQQLRSDQ
jgi:hypothetical protein